MSSVTRQQHSAVHWSGGNENSRIWNFHLDTLRVPKLVPHPALQPGAEVVDPSNGKRRFPRPEGWNPAVRYRILRVSGPKPKGKILESENANGPLSHEMALELICGADFWCNRHCRTSPVVLAGFWGQVWPKIDRKQRTTKILAHFPPCARLLNSGSSHRAGLPERSAQGP